MLKVKPTANPSMLVTINKWFDRGLITDGERARLRKEVLGVNVYTGKARTNETRISNNRVLRFESSKKVD